MNPATKQDVQNIVDVTRNRVMERMLTKQDISSVVDCMKTIQALQQQNQQLLRQLDAQITQSNRRITTLESRAVSLETEVRSLRMDVQRLGEQRQQIVMPVQTEDNASGFTATRYATYQVS